MIITHAVTVYCPLYFNIMHTCRIKQRKMVAFCHSREHRVGFTNEQRLINGLEQVVC